MILFLSLCSSLFSWIALRWSRATWTQCLPRSWCLTTTLRRCRSSALRSTTFMGPTASALGMMTFWVGWNAHSVRWDTCVNIFLMIFFLSRNPKISAYFSISTDSGSEKDGKAVATEIRKIRRKVQHYGEFCFRSIVSATECTRDWAIWL